MSPNQDIGNNAFSRQYQNKIFFYFVLAFASLLVILKLPMASIYYETASALITFSPMVVILAMAVLAYWNGRKYQEYQSVIRKFYLIFTLKFLVAILIFYIFYSPGLFSGPLLALFQYLKTILTLEGLYFVSSYFLTVLISLAVIFVAFRAYQKSQGTYVGSIRILTRKMLYSVFGIFFFVFVSSAAAYPSAYKPLTDTLGDTIYTLSSGSLKFFKGDEFNAYTRIESFRDFSSRFSKSLSQTSKNVSEHNQEFKISLDSAKDNLTASISKSSQDLSDKIKQDLSGKLETAGGTLEGALILKGESGDLTIEGLTTTRDIIPDDTLTYDLGKSGKSWNTLYIHRLMGASPVFIGNGSSEQGLVDDGDLMVSGSLEVQGAIYANELNINNAYTFPATDGTAGQVLQTNGSGALSWEDASGSIPGGADGQLQFNSGGALGGSARLAWDDDENALDVDGDLFASGRIGIGTDNPQAELDIFNGTPEILLTNSQSGEYASISRRNTNNALSLNNRSDTYTPGSAHFDGNGDYIDFGHIGALELGTSDFSISFWINDASDNGEIINLNNGGTGGAEGQRIFLEGRKIKAFLVDDSLNQIVNDYLSDTAISQGAWTNVVIVKSGNNLTGYINGAEGNTYNIGPVLGSYPNSTAVGQTGDAFLAGDLDEFVIWNKALSGAEIAAEYNSGSGIEHDSSDPNIIAGWHFDDVERAAADFSGNNHNGTLNGNADWVPGMLGGGKTVTADLPVLSSQDRLVTLGSAGSNLLIKGYSLGIRSNVGIGTISPDTRLQVYGDSGNLLKLQSSTYLDTPGQTMAISFAQRDGIEAGKIEAITEENGKIGFAFSTYDFGLAESLRISAEGNVGIGDTTPDTTLKVAGSICAKADDTDCFGNTAGNIYAANFIVDGTTHLPDYVFEPDYPLMPLPELKNYLDLNKHLPGVPSAGEVSQNGLNLSQMVPAILEKTEENTLYIIQSNDQLSQISLKTDESVGTLSELQVSVDEQLGVIGEGIADMKDGMENMSEEQKKLDRQVQTLGSQFSAQESLLSLLQSQMAELQARLNTETNLAQIDLNVQDTAFIKLLLGTDRVKNPEDVDILGRLSAKTLSTGGIEITVIDPDAPTIGTAIVKAGEKMTTVKTKAVEDNSNVFVTIKSKLTAEATLMVTGVKKGESFDVELVSPLQEDLTFNWWLVGSKLNQ